MKPDSTVLRALLVSAAVVTPVLAEDHHASALSFKTQSLTNNISMLSGQGGNVAVMSGDQGLLMIDDDYQKMSPALQRALTPFGGEDKLTYIINTHWHGDHTQGNLHFGHSAQIIAHDNVRERLLTSQEVKLFNMKTQPYPEHALPSITYEKALTLHMNGEEVELLHLPGGHTDGDSVVFFKKANVVHMGDHFFNGFFPFVDVENGGNVARMAQNVGQVLTMLDAKAIIIPGHGPIATKPDLTAFKRMLEGTSAEIEGMRAKGMSLKEMQTEGLSEQWDEWTDGFLSESVWISIVNSSLDSK